MTEKLPDDITIEETTKAGVFRRRRLDLTEKWARDGVIDDALHEAAVQFGEAYERGQCRARHSSLDLNRVDTSHDNDTPVTQVIDAQAAVVKSLEAVGLLAGAVLVDVIGERMSLREHCHRRQAGKVPMNVHEAKGRLIVGLDLLARHYRLI